MTDPFILKDCALLAIATGQWAQNLRELGDKLAEAHPGCVYYHFWGGLLRPRFDDPEYRNDFAAWARHGLHDARLAERLGIIDPTDFEDLEQLRREVIEVIEERLDESEIVPWAKSDQQFHFIRSQIVVFDTGVRINEPGRLKPLIPFMSVGSLFYHFIDARRRAPRSKDDFSAWLEGFGDTHADLIKHLATVDPYFGSLTELRSRLASIFNGHMEGLN